MLLMKKIEFEGVWVRVERGRGREREREKETEREMGVGLDVVEGGVTQLHMTHSYVTLLIHVCAMTHLQVYHDSLICKP